MQHILDLYLADKNGDYLRNLNDYLELYEDFPKFDIDSFKKFLEENRDKDGLGRDEIGYIYQHPQITGFNSDNIGCKNLCDQSDSKIMDEMKLDDESTEEEWEEYYEATTTARCEILDTIADYAVLVSKDDNERVFVMLNSWYDPIFTKSYPKNKPIYDNVW